MGNEANAGKLIGACTYNGSSVAVVTFFSIAEIVEFLTVRAQAAIGPTQRNIYRRDCHASVRLVGGVAPAIDDTANSLVLTVYKMDGTTLVTFTLTTMKCGSHSYTIIDASPPGEWEAEFLHMGSLATSNLAIT